MAFWLRAKQGLLVCLRDIFFCIEGHNLNPRNHTYYPVCYLRVWEISRPQAPLLLPLLLPLYPPPSPSISLALTYHLVGCSKLLQFIPHITPSSSCLLFRRKVPLPFMTRYTPIILSMVRQFISTGTDLHF